MDSIQGSDHLQQVVDCTPYSIVCTRRVDRPIMPSLFTTYNRTSVCRARAHTDSQMTEAIAHVLFIVHIVSCTRSAFCNYKY